MRRRWNRRMGAVLLVVLGACGQSIAGPGDTERTAIEPFVGTWDAVVFTVAPAADPTDIRNLLLNGSFNIVVQPSGLYTATLVWGEFAPLVEIGQLTVVGSFLTLTPTGGTDCPAASEFTFSAADYVSLTGPTCFDFNLDGEDEDGEAHLELRRR